jgi:hypothetical protein
MSSPHCSKFDLNTYASMPYFEANIPEDYPLRDVMGKCRRFRNLPPHLIELSKRAKEYAAKNFPVVVREVSKWYDDEGNELDPDTKKPLTDDEVNAMWIGIDQDDFEVKDIPIPSGGFPDPSTWKQSPSEPDESHKRYVPSKERLLMDIESHGRARTADEYGIPVEELPTAPGQRD